MALCDGFAEKNLAMAIRKRRESQWGLHVFALQVRVERPEALLEGIREAFVVAAGQRHERPGHIGDQGGVTQHKLVRTIAVSNPQLVGSFAFPRHRPYRSATHAFSISS